MRKQIKLFVDATVTHFLHVKLKSNKVHETFFFFYHGSLCDPLRFKLSRAVLLKAFSIRSVWSHYTVEAGPSRLEALLLGFIVTFDQSHEFTHAVT